MPVTTAKEIVKLKMPSLNLPSPSVPPDDNIRVDDFITLAMFFISERIFGPKYEYALALVVCHQLTLDAQGGGDSTTSGSGVVGGIKTEKEGDLARGYGLGNGVNLDLSEWKMYWVSTPFGQELLSLFNACILIPRNRFVSGR